jgi:hypothetical protein
MASWSPPTTRSEALARMEVIFPDSIEEQGRVFRALARLSDRVVLNLFAPPSMKAVKATLRAELTENTGESCLGTVGRACHLERSLLDTHPTCAKAAPGDAEDLAMGSDLAMHLFAACLHVVLLAALVCKREGPSVPRRERQA